MQYVTSSNLTQMSKPSEARDEGDGDAALIKRLEELLSVVRGQSHAIASDPVHNPSRQFSARELYSSRRAIDTCFGMNGFSSSPAWDIMLDLFQNEQNGKTVSITSACIGAACPGTTALRWLQALIGMSLIERHDDQSDKRRTYITLTPKGRDATLSAIKSHPSP